MFISNPIIEMEINSVGSWNPSTNTGYYEACLTRDGHRHYFSARQDKTTASRSIIKGMIDVVKSVDESASIKLYSTTPIGVKTKKSVNSDLINELLTALATGMHKSEFIVLEGQGNEMRELIQSAEGFVSPRVVLPTLKKSTQLTPADHRWSVYVLNPVDFGWDHLGSVEETLAKIDRGQAERDSAHLPYDLAYNRKQFSRDYLLAQELAKAHGMGSDLKQASVFWIPGDTKFDYGFVFKESSNGTTYVTSPFPIQTLATLSNQSTSGLKGTPAQIKYANDIITKTHSNLDKAATCVPKLSDSIDALKEVLDSIEDSKWIITNQQDLYFLILRNKLDGSHVLTPGTVLCNKLVTATPPHLIGRVKPLLDYAENMGRLDHKNHYSA